jgi:hypothetical protein
MGQRIIGVGVALLGIGLLVRLLVGPGMVRAQSVEQANQRLEQTEHQVAIEVTKSATSAKALATDFESADGQDRLPAELAEFVRSTDRLRQLQADLEKDINNYDTARTAKLVEFDTELKLIKDNGTRRHMERLRARSQRHTTEQLQNARTALDTLAAVLNQGTDLQHAAKCVQLADELQLQGNDLATQVVRAKEQIATYNRLSNTLLAKLTTNTAAAD